MNPKLYKYLLVGIVILSILGSSLMQNALVGQRHELGLDRYTELKGAPPVLALTTVALGGFRGLISNALWIRASDLQENDKFFEMVQLADWITKLEPHFTQVWLVQAWNMAYNISVKFKDPQDRWRWVQRGIELLRDEGLKYNPNDVLIHRELAWFFQHKMGQNLDDAHNTYKSEWGKQMINVLGLQSTNMWEDLLHPSTPEMRERLGVLTNKLKMDPVVMKAVDDLYGPVEWRLPEASAIYWAYQGLEAAKRNSRAIDPNDLITLHRVVYQSMQMSFQRGRLVKNNALNRFEYGPNLAIIPKVSDAYEQAMVDDPKNRDHIETAHRNFLRDAVWFLYTYNREQDAIKWFKYIAQKYPDKALLNMVSKSLPTQISLDDYALGRLQDEMNDLGRDKAKAIIEGLEARAFDSLAMDEDDHYLGLHRLAEKAWGSYEAKISGMASNKDRVGLPPLSEIRRTVLDRMLNEELPPQMAAVLRSKLGLKNEPKPAASTPAESQGETAPVPGKP